MQQILVIIGFFFVPRFTIGCILCHYNHETLGIILILASLFMDDEKEKDKTNKTH